MKRLILLALLVLATGPASAAEIRFEGLPRACAGGLPDSVHRIKLRALVQNPGAVKFVLLNSRGAHITGALAGQAVILQPDAAGRIQLQVQGGHFTGTPWLVAQRNGRELGRIRLDFAPPARYRRFSDPYDSFSGEDTGFLFQPGFPVGKIYLKFRKRLSLGDVNGNWFPVADHRLRIYVDSVDVRVDQGKVLKSPEEVARYGRVYNLQDPKAKECIVTTRTDGSAQFGITTFGSDDEITISAEDLTAKDSPDYRPPAMPLTQELRDSGERANLPIWLPVPKDISGRAIWYCNASYGDNTWQWSDLKHGQHAAPQSIPVNWGGLDREAGSQAFSVRLSPDASRALFLVAREGQDLDGCHDTLVANLKSGQLHLWHSYLFGSSETWSPASDRIAFVAGSRDTVFGHPIDEPLRLGIRAGDVIESQNSSTPSHDASLRSDDGLDRDSLAWTMQGDLLAGSAWVRHSDPTRLDVTPYIVRLRAGAGKARLWQTRACKPVSSLDGRHIAFFGSEPAPDGNWRDTSPALCVAQDEKHRKALTRLPPGASTAFFQSDNRHVLLFHMNSDYALHSIVASAAYDAHRPDLSPIGVSLALVQFDIQTRARRVVADLSSLYKPWVDQVPPGMDDYQPIGPSPDGHYFYFKCREMQSENGWGKITANTLYAIRLRDGALIPVAIFPDEFDFRPASGA